MFCQHSCALSIKNKLKIEMLMWFETHLFNRKVNLINIKIIKFGNVLEHPIYYDN